MTMANNERISVLMDGETTEASWLKSVLQDSQQQETWGRYHLIGDALRQSQHLAVRVDQAVHDRLVDEPTVLAPRAQPAPVSRPMTSSAFSNRSCAAAWHRLAAAGSG